MPGFGLVAAIAVNQFTKQLNLAHHGNIVSEEFPQVTAFEDGRVRDAVRMYAGTDPSVLTLQSDVVLPPRSFPPLAECVLDDLAQEFDRAIFLAGAPAESESELGRVTGVTTSDELRSEFARAGVQSTGGIGLVGGTTGALANACYRAEIPAMILIVEAHPFLPDPAAARAALKSALEPFVDFDIETTELEEQAEAIQQRMQQIAERVQQQQQVQEFDRLPPESGGPSTYQ